MEFWAKGFASLSLAAIWVAPCYSSDSKAIVQGIIRDASGKPLKGLPVSMAQGSYTTYGTTLVVPIITRNAIGAFGVNFPDDPHFHEINGHHTKTDNRGHYRFNVVPGWYEISLGYLQVDRSQKRTGFASKYVYPPRRFLSVPKAEMITTDFILDILPPSSALSQYSDATRSERGAEADTPAPSVASFTSLPSDTAQRVFELKLNRPNDVANFQIQFNDELLGPNACRVYIDVWLKQIFVADDASQKWVGPARIGGGHLVIGDESGNDHLRDIDGSVRVGNSRCSVDPVNSSFNVDFNELIRDWTTLTAKIAISFGREYVGTKTAFLQTWTRKNANLEWHKIGTYTIAAQ